MNRIATSITKIITVFITPTHTNFVDGMGAVRSYKVHITFLYLNQIGHENSKKTPVFHEPENAKKANIQAPEIAKMVDRFFMVWVFIQCSDVDVMFRC